jgi:hypothetical protein
MNRKRAGLKSGVYINQEQKHRFEDRPLKNAEELRSVASGEFAGGFFEEIVEEDGPKTRWKVARWKV